MKTISYIIILLLLGLFFVFDKQLNRISRGKGMQVTIILVVCLSAVAFLIYHAGDHADMTGMVVQTAPPPSQPGVTEDRPSGPRQAQQSEDQTIPAIVRKIGPSVVVINIYNERRELRGRGSGFFIDRNGSVITNHHVIKGASYTEVKTASGKLYPVKKILFEDASNDLAVLSVDIPSGAVAPLSVISALPEAGEKIVVIGSPLGLEQTVSDGIVSAIRRPHGSGEYIQITAPISPGSSGSPVVNMKGEVIGVASFLFVQGQNLNFCAPGEKVLRLIAGNGNPPPQSANARSPYYPGTTREIYCWMLPDGTVEFTDNPVKRRMGYNPLLISRPDGTIDAVKYQSWIFEQLGMNPLQFDPAVEAQKAVENEKSVLFSRTFPGKSMNQGFTLQEQQFWQNNLNQFYRDRYIEAVARKNAAIVRYKYMVDALNRYYTTLDR